MLNEQQNRPSLRKSISFAGITNHSHNSRRPKNRRFNLQKRNATSPTKNNPHFKSHPYKTEKENTAMTHKESEKSLSKSSSRFFRKLDTDDMRILDVDVSLTAPVKSILDIANQMQRSLKFEKDKSDTKDDTNTSINHLKDRLLKRQNSENTEKRRPSTVEETASQLKLDVNDHHTSSLHASNADSDEDERISMPCLGDKFSYSNGNPTEKTALLHLISSEGNIVKQEETQSCEELKENPSPKGEIGLCIDSDLTDQLHKLETTPRFDCDDFREGFSLSIIIVPKSPSLTTPPVRTSEDRLLEDLRCSDINPNVRDMLCVESHTQEPDADCRLTPNDYRQALTLQDKFTCLFCGTNLEIIPFDDFTTSPNDIHDFGFDQDDSQSCISSPYYSHCNDLTMFCPLCCENRLVQNYSWMH